MKTVSTTYLTSSDMALRLGLNPRTFGDWRRKGTVPAPTHQLSDSSRYYYVSTEEPAIRAALNRAGEPKFLSKSAMAAACKVSVSIFAGMLADGTLPEPTNCNGSRPVYAADEVAKIKAAIANRESMLPRQRAGFWTREQMSDELKIDLSTFSHFVHRGVLSKPTHRFGGRKNRFYVPADYKVLKQQFEKYIARGRSMPKGYYTGMTAAVALNMPVITYRLYLKRGVLPKPTKKPHGVGFKFLFYDEKDIRQMRKVLKNCGYYHRKIVGKPRVGQCQERSGQGS